MRHDRASSSLLLATAVPRWFRVVVVACAVLILCSCRTAQPEYRVADVAPAKAVVADEPVRDDGAVQLAAAAFPAETSPAESAPGEYGAAPCPPEGGPSELCGPGGCPCCGDAAGPGPSDEYLCDGGDMHLPAAVVRTGRVVGLEPEDAVAHYDTIDGRTVVTPSNKVCIYAPRFAAIRQVVDLRALARYDAAKGAVQRALPVRIDEEEKASTSLAAIEPTIHRAKDPPSRLRERQQAGELDRDRRAAVTISSLAPYANLQIVCTGELVGKERVEIARASLAAITWAGDQAAQVVLDSRQAHADVGVQTPGTIYLLVEPNNPKLRLVKLASTDSALPGEEVEFTLRFDNVGDRVIGNVTIVDSLTTRLEYIPDSQKSSIKANFLTRPNDGNSLVLRWEIAEPLQPGAGGVIQFRTRVR